MIHQIDNINVLIDELMREYEGTKFIFKDEVCFLRLIYDNKELVNDENFFDFVYALSNKYLSYENNLRLAVTYDYLDEHNY